MTSEPPSTPAVAVLTAAVLLLALPGTATAQPGGAAPSSSSTRTSLTLTHGDLSATIGVDREGVLSYALTRISDGRAYVAPSRLAIELEEADFTRRLSAYKQGKTVRASSTYELASGKTRDISSPYIEGSFGALNAEDQLLTVRLRLYEDGLAFRYEFDDLFLAEGSGDTVTVIAERSEFALPAGLRAWRQVYDEVARTAPAYERYYENEASDASDTTSRGFSFPLYAFGEGTHVLLHESASLGQYFGSHLGLDGTTYVTRSPSAEEALGLYDTLAHVPRDLPYSPWRIVVAGATAQAILATTLVTDVAPSRARDRDYAWVAPGRAVWSWWSDWPSPRSFAKQVNFVDFAAERGWEYALVDANWNEMEGGNVEQLVAYAADKGVGILLWYNSGGPHNAVTEMPRDSMHASEIRRREFRRIADLGVAGIKVDFFQSDKQRIMSQYVGLLEDAAEAELLVNVHGCTVPRGLRRRYPHLLTAEAVVGAENYEYNAGFPGRAPAHHTVLPFTRNAVGPMDYTPVTFTNRRYPRKTSDAHELALSVLFESGIQHFADDVERYRSLPDYALELLDTVPVVWDEVELLGGTPGEWIAIARRKGDTWYFGVVNGVARPLEVELPTWFAPDGLTYVTDDDIVGEGSYRLKRGQTPKGEVLEIEVAPFGGVVGVAL